MALRFVHKMLFLSSFSFFLYRLFNNIYDGVSCLPFQWLFLLDVYSLNHIGTASNEEQETAGPESTWRDDSLERGQKKKTLVGKQKEKHEVETNNRDSGDAWRRVKWEFFFNFFFLLFWMICWNWNYKKTARSLPTRMLQRRKGYRTVLHFRYCLFTLLFWVMIYLPDIHKCRNRRVVAIWASESSRVIRVCWGRWIGCRPCKCDCRTTWCANLSV